MSILTKIKDKESHFSIKFFGQNDWATAFNLKIMLDKSNIILDYFNKKKHFSINKYNDFIDYLFLKEQIKYLEVLDVIIDEKKKEAEKYLNEISTIYSKYLDRDVFVYLNNHYKTVFKIQKLRFNCNTFEEFSKEYNFDRQQYDIEDIALNLIAKYAFEISEQVINYLLKYYLPEIYNKMDLFYGYFGEHYEKLLSKNNIEKCVINSNYGMNRIDNIAEVLIKLNNKKVKIDKYLNIYVKLLKENYFEPDDEDLFQSHQIIQGLIPYLNRLQTPYYNDFVREEKLQQERISDWLRTKGKKFEYKIDLKPILDLFDTDNFSVFSILTLTHSLNKKTNKFDNLFSTIGDMAKSITDDLFSSNIETNNYFSNSFLRNMSMQNDMIIQILNKILSDRKRFNRLFDAINTFINEISRKANISITEEDLGNDYNIIVFYLNKLFLDQIDDVEKNALLYGCISFLCGEIEKILRVVYLKENPNIYIKNNMITLGGLLNFENEKNTLLTILGYDNMRCLSYYLTSDRQNERIGLNIRNEIDHLNFEKVKPDKAICILVFRLYLNIINSLFVYYD